MKQITATAIPVFHDPFEQAVAEKIASACQSRAGMLGIRWNLSVTAGRQILARPMSRSGNSQSPAALAGEGNLMGYSKVGKPERA